MSVKLTPEVVRREGKKKWQKRKVDIEVAAYVLDDKKALISEIFQLCRKLSLRQITLDTQCFTDCDPKAIS